MNELQRIREALEGFLNDRMSLAGSHPHFASYFAFPDEQSDPISHIKVLIEP